MIDFHAHVLPGIDDGSDSVETSLDMLAESRRRGVRVVVATPHCYLLERDTLQDFLKRRNNSFRLLKKAMESEQRSMPELRLGCELRLVKDASEVQGIEGLCIEGTNYILLEMPYTKWSNDLYDCIYSLQLKGMKPIMAHIERFFDKKNEFCNLRSLDVCFQVNAESFSDPITKHCIPELFKMGMLQLLGTDMHNMTSRPPCLIQGFERIERVYGKERAEYLMINAERVLNNEDILKLRFEKPGLFKRMRL